MQRFKKISFLIPALNEAGNIGQVLQSIALYAPPDVEREVIVGDHGSTDATREIAIQHGAVLLEKRGGTIAELRNAIAAEATGDLLIYNDADVLLTEVWKASISDVIDSISSAYRDFLLGGILTPPTEKNWIIDNWFRVQRHERKDYVGTGHLIVPRATFDLLKGFDAALTTGEDYDFSVRAKALRIGVFIDERLSTVHLDYPRSLKAFFLREIWHGTGDLKNARTLLRSKVAIAAFGYAILLVSFLLNTLSVGKWLPLHGILIFAAPLSLSFAKFRGLPVRKRLTNTFLWAVYLAGRASSPLARRFRRRPYARKGR